MRNVLLLALAVVVSSQALQAQPGAARPEPWFGLTLPGGATVPAVHVGARPPRPASRTSASSRSCRIRCARRSTSPPRRSAGLEATNAVAVIPGASAETIVLNAHADGWFDGAGDNADGLAVLMALARHYAKAGAPPARTIVFVASAGHHTPGVEMSSSTSPVVW